MTKIQADMCDCCKEIWNENNLKDIKVGDHIMHFCSDCFTEYIKPLNTIRAEIVDAAFDWQEIDGEHESFMVIDLNDALNIIDKYMAERSEDVT